MILEARNDIFQDLSLSFQDLIQEISSLVMVLFGPKEPELFIRILFKPSVFLPRYLKSFKLFQIVLNEKIIIK